MYKQGTTKTKTSRLNFTHFFRAFQKERSKYVHQQSLRC